MIKRPAALLATSAGGLSFALAVLAFLAPALAAIAPTFFSPGRAGAPFSRIWPALAFTLTEAGLSTLAAVALGLPAAFLVARRDFPGRRLLLALSGVPLCVPPIIVALAFVLFYGRQGYLNVALMRFFRLDSPPVTFLYSLGGIVVAHGFYDFPVVLRTVAQVWERLPAAEEEAARLLGASRARVFFTVVLPRLSGAIFSSAALVFLYCFFSFVIVLLFGGIGGTTLEVELYQAARSAFDFRLAGSIALIETASALGIVALYVAAQRRLSRGAAGLTECRVRKPIGRGGEAFALVAFLIFLCVFFGGPLVSVLLRSVIVPGKGLYGVGFRVSFSAWAMLFSRMSFSTALFRTVSVGLAVAALSVGAGLFFALREDSSSRAPKARRRKAIDTTLVASASRLSFYRLIPLAPLAVSSVVLGFGWTLVSPRGNAATLALAQTAMAWPFAWTQIRAALDRVPRPLVEAASLLSPEPIDLSFRVLIPLARRGILSGAAFAFAISAGDATLPLVLSIGRFENLSLMLYRLVGSYRFSEACACAVVLAALSGFAFFLESGATKAKEL